MDSIDEHNEKHLFRNLYGETLLTNLFFSKQNIENIQNVIKLLIYRQTNMIIDKQSYNELMVIMRSLFLEHSRHPKLLTENMEERQKRDLLQKYTNEVSRLNQLVINTVVPKVISQMQQYITYLQDSTAPPFQQQRPTNESIAGQREYKSITQVLLGTKL